MMRGALPLSVLLAATVTHAALAQGVVTISVKAGPHDVARLPVSAEVPVPDGFASIRLTDAESGAEVPCQWERPDAARVRVLWVVDELRQGEQKRYRLTFGDAPAPEPKSRVTVEQAAAGAIEIRIGEELLGVYRFGENEPRPYVWPLIGPTGKPITRAYPMEKDVPGETTDHVHHRSFWFTFGAVNGLDFWGEAKHCGRIVHREFEALESGPVMGRLRARSDWISADGKKILEDVRELRVYNTTDPRVMDFEVTLIASEGPVVLGDTKEGMMAFRVASSMDVKRGGRIENSRGGINEPQTWGKRAEWCDYSGPVEGETVGIAILDHPDNFRHPTYWMVRNYGLFAANPFGVRIFTGDQTKDGSHTIPAGESLTFKYRVYLHRGNAGDAKMSDRWDSYVNPPNVTVAASRGEARGEAELDPKVPEGYKLVFEEDFEQGHADNWQPRPGSEWRIEESGEGTAYRLLKGGPPGEIRAPFGYSILKDHEVGDFALVVRARCLSPSSRRGRDVNLLFGYRDDTHFYYVHFSNYSNAVHNAILVVDGKAREPLKLEGKPIARLTDEKWHWFKVERDAKSGQIRAYLDDMEEPVLVANDARFAKGRIGIGSFDDPAAFDIVRLYVPGR